MDELRRDFDNRETLTDYVASLSPWLDDYRPGIFVGGADAARERLQAIDPVNYGRTRNFLDGAVTRLSPYIRHGVLTLDEVRNEALQRSEKPSRIEKFIQELAWRDYWQQVWLAKGDSIHNDLKNEQSPVSNFEIPEAVVSAKTGIELIDREFISAISEGREPNGSVAQCLPAMRVLDRIEQQLTA